MAKINDLASGHGSKSETYSGGLVINYNFFPNATPTETARLAKMRRSHKILDNLERKIDLNGPCNSYFRNLPNGRSFRQIWQDNTIFINYSPSLTNGFYGATHSNDKDICVSAWCLDNKNRWMIAATIVHELAHIGGAPGGTSHDAEKAVEKCGFNPQYDPTIIGSIEKLGVYLETIA